ncbi:MAG: pyridoxal phosphate-dependent aminotransferase [Firmicutes bacterium]|nr:pyridoxal phosphate-dependent aminotransferase [Bacillota bacterium]
MKYDFETVMKRYGCGSRKWDEMREYGYSEIDDIIPFSVADMEFAPAPEIVQGLQDYISCAVLGYSGATNEFKLTVCDWVEKRHGYRPKEDWILTTQGVVDAFYQAINSFTEEGDGVMLLTPVYYPMYNGIRANNRTLVDCPLVRKGTRYEIDFEDFEAKAKDENTKMFILCNPHNPCSRVWTPEELTKIAQICAEHNVFVVSDEIHFDLMMKGFKHTMFLSLGEELTKNAMSIIAPSKTFNLAGLQTSMVLIPNPDHRETFLKGQMKHTGNPKCNILGYEACQIAYKNCEPWLDAVLDVIAENKRVIEEFFAEHFPQIKIMDFEATYLLWMDWSGLGIEAKELERINREEAGLFFDEGYIFGEAGDCFERWNLACPTWCIEDALDRMKETYDKYLNQ